MMRFLNCLGVLLLPQVLSAFQCESSTGSSKEADPMSCSKYYSCYDGVTEPQECEISKTFDVKFKICRSPEEVESCRYAPRDCYTDKGSGFDYQGNVSVTSSKAACLPWDHNYYSFNKDKLAENFCRNPKPDTYMKPWCEIKSDDPADPIEFKREECDIPTCSGASASFNGDGYITMNTGTGSANSTYDLEASYEEQILLYIRTTHTEESSVIFRMSSQSDDQTYFVKLYQKVITVYAWLEAGGTMAKANTWIDLADGQTHKIVIKRQNGTIYLRVDNGPQHYSDLPGVTDKLMLPMSVEIGKHFKGCIASLDIITRNADRVYRHYEPLEKLAGKTADEQMVVTAGGSFSAGFASGCMLTPRFSEIMTNIVHPTTVPPIVHPTNGTTAKVGSKDNKDLYVILACVIGAALLILLVVLVIVCRSRNKDKGVYKLKETKQFDWEYGNLPPASKNSLVRESEHGV